MSSTLKILIAESRDFSAEALALLSNIGEVRLEDLDRSELSKLAADCDLLWVRLRNRIDRDLLQRARRLQAIATPTTGLNHIDLDEAARRGIRVFSLRGETDFLKDIRATAEHTIGLTLALLRHIPGAVQNAHFGTWNRDAFRGSELCGKTVGVVGYGRLGRLVAGYFRAFGAHIIAADPHVTSSEAENFVEMAPLEALLMRSDVVTLHVSLSADTEKFFGLEQFQRMKRGSWFVNTARGELIDEAALLKALDSGHISGAALDVLCGETLPEFYANPLLRYAQTRGNLLITPHIGGCTSESMAKTEIFLARKIAAAYKSQGTLRQALKLVAVTV